MSAPEEAPAPSSEASAKPRVAYLLRQYPQLSESYVKSEIDAIRDTCEVLVLAFAEPDLPYESKVPYRVSEDWEEIAALIGDFQPHVLHTHWLYTIWDLEYFARRLSVPYTLRAHSFDVLTDPLHHYETAVELVNDDLCLGVLTFPFGKPLLEQAGMREDKLVPCFPVVSYGLFHDESPNGDRVMNVGACIAKKRMEDFLDLAVSMPERSFDLYPVGYETPDIVEKNRKLGDPVTIFPTMPLEQMPVHYKKHEWLVYTASHEIGTVGWPMAIAEAQASGVGVCMANIRPDLREYVGDCGFLFDSISEVSEILSRPFPAELREEGFEHARKSDVAEHRRLLFDLWGPAVPGWHEHP
jgi:hypothetical protein